MARWKITKRFIPILALFLLFFTGCSALDRPGPLNPKGSVGEEQLWLIMWSIGIMVFVMVVVFALFVYVIIRYRKRKGQTGIPEQVPGNHKLEVIWTIIPIFLIIALAIPTVTSTFALAEDYSDSKEAVQVKVTGHQFWWEFEYKDYGVRTAQELVIPIDKKVMYDLVTSDVNHSFWIPAHGGKMDLTAGLTNKMYLEGNELGTFRGRCAELCGYGHALMNFHVKVVTQEQFDSWIQSMQAPAMEVPQELQQGSEIFTARCIGCHAISSSEMGLGPNLTGFADRDYIAGFLEFNDSNLRDWIEDPASLKPGALMPGSDLSDEEFTELIKYLNSLKLAQTE